MKLSWRDASEGDLDLLAEWNHQLIRDEGHRNPMTQAELRARMKQWLETEYRAVVFSDSEPVAYALFKTEDALIYLRQLFVRRDRRRAGVGRAAMDLLKHEVWPAGVRLTVDVLCANHGAIAFWRSVGYRDYCLTLEMMPEARKTQEVATEGAAMADEITIRPATPADLADINGIYNYYVAHSTCVWGTQPCSESERRAWYDEHGQTMPVLVAESKGRIVGWAALGSFRAVYTAAGTLEDSLYVHHDFHRRKIGSRLLAALIEAARRMGVRSLLANISADQTPSIRLHEKFGFQKAAHLRGVGQKFNQRFDAVYLQLLLVR